MSNIKDLVLDFPGQTESSDVIWVEGPLSLSIGGDFDGNVHIQRCMNERSQYPDESTEFNDVDVFSDPKQAITEEVGAFYRVKLSEGFSGNVKVTLRTRLKI